MIRITAESPKSPVPQSAEEAEILILKIKNRNQLVDDINSRVKAAISSAIEAIEPIEQQIKEATASLQMWAEANRTALTNKTIKLKTGDIVWRATPPAVKISDTEENVIQACEAANHKEFVRTKKSLNKDAIKANPEKALDIPAITITRSEQFVVIPKEVS